MRTYLFILLAGLATVTCRNPFFPPSESVEGESYRDTPAGVIRQLTTAYERRSILLFQNLISDDFRFYVSPSFTTEYQADPGAVSWSVPDSLYLFVTGGRYYYWTKDQEIQAHKGMFSAADQITFASQPYVNEALFSYTIEVDTTNTDTSFQGDTTAVEIRMLNGEIKIVAGQEHTEYTVDIGEQVFVLGRDPKDPELWIINRWFDLGTASN